MEKQRLITEVKTARKVEWEAFLDISYYDMYCCRPKGERNFNSTNSHHFATVELANAFMTLMKESF